MSCEPKYTRRGPVFVGHLSPANESEPRLQNRRLVDGVSIAPPTQPRGQDQVLRGSRESPPVTATPGRRTLGSRAPELTRSRLLGAAKHLFARHGLNGVSVAQIAKRAGVSVAMINHHFGGKQALYRSCLKGFGNLRLAALDRMLVSCATREEFAIRLELLVVALLDLHLEDPDVVSILLRDVSSAEHWGPALEKSLLEFTFKLSHFFELGRERGFLRRGVEPIVPATLIYLTLAGLLQADAHRSRVTGSSLRDPTHRAATVKNLVDVVLNGAAT